MSFKKQLARQTLKQKYELVQEECKYYEGVAMAQRDMIMQFQKDLHFTHANISQFREIYPHVGSPDEFIEFITAQEGFDMDAVKPVLTKLYAWLWGYEKEYKLSDQYTPKDVSASDDG